MSKLQFFLISSIVTSVLLLVIGGKDNYTIIPVSVMIALSYLGNRFIPGPLWEKFALWVNRTTNRRFFQTRLKRLPPSRARRVPKS